MVRGDYKGQQVSKVVQCYRKKLGVYIERIQRVGEVGQEPPSQVHIQRERVKALGRDTLYIGQNFAATDIY